MHWKDWMYYNFWNGEDRPMSSASEYVIANNRSIVSVNDEAMGVGLEILEWSILSGED